MTGQFMLRAGCAAITVSMITQFTVAAAQEERGLNRTDDQDIVVTAQRREQKLQDVPIAVSALGSAALERASGIGPGGGTAGPGPGREKSPTRADRRQRLSTGQLGGGRLFTASGRHPDPTGIGRAG